MTRNLHLSAITSITFVFAAIASTLTAAPQPVVNVQGRAVIAGTSPSGALKFKFAIGDKADSQTYWRHDGDNSHGVPPDPTALTVPVNAGAFSVLLGDESIPGMASFDTAVFDRAEVYLRIWVSDGVLPYQRLLPDRRMVATPYAVIATTVEDNAITTDKIADGAVTFDKIQGGAVGAFSLANNAVQAHALAPDIVSADKLTSNAVTTSKLANSAVATAKLANGAVTEPKLGSNAVTSVKIADLAVTTSKIDHFAVGRGQIQNGAVDSAKIAFGEVTANNLASASVTTDKIMEANVTTSKLADGSVTYGKINPTVLEELSRNNGTRLPPGAMVIGDRPCDPTFLEFGLTQVGVLPGRRASFGEIPGGDVVGHRKNGTAVWDGRRVMIFGGTINGNLTNDHWYLNPMYDDGRPENFRGEFNRPSNREKHTAVWTGQNVLIWGGFDGNGHSLGDGSVKFDEYGVVPWFAIDMTEPEAPSPRGGHSAIWTGSEMIIWGGRYVHDNEDTLLSDGAAYNPETNEWRAIAQPPESFAGRWNHAAAWSGDRMYIHGGEIWDAEAGYRISTGTFAAYHPFSDTWEILPEFSNRQNHTAVWAAKRLVIFGDAPFWIHERAGAQYDPVNNSWEDIPVDEDLMVDENTAVIWTGESVLVGVGPWVGSTYPFPRAWDPVTKEWSTFQHSRGLLFQRGRAVWTGEDVISCNSSPSLGVAGSFRFTPPSPTRYLYRVGGGS